MKKLILIGLVILGLVGCTVKGSPDGQIKRGMPIHNDAVISAQNQLIIKQNEQIIEKLNQIDNQLKILQRTKEAKNWQYMKSF